jgi:hypothetical protein
LQYLLNYESAWPHYMFEVIAEQVGVAEGEFKSRVSHGFEIFGTVERAYLALVRHDFPPTPATNGGVALCLAFRPGAAADRTIAHCLATFRQMFSGENFLDVIPLDASMEAAVQEHCKPFWEGSAN